LSATSELNDAVEFADNPEPRCPCVLLMDTSGSMAGARIDALNEGLRTFRDDLLKDSLASRRIELALVAFSSGVETVQNFVTVDQFEPPRLEAGGQTHMARRARPSTRTTGSRITGPGCSW
jgi:uncharacterized protein YegL